MQTTFSPGENSLWISSSEERRFLRRNDTERKSKPPESRSGKKENTPQDGKYLHNEKSVLKSLLLVHVNSY